MYLRHYDRAHNADLSQWTPWTHQGDVLGYVQPAFRDRGLEFGLWRWDGNRLTTVERESAPLTDQFAAFADTVFKEGLLTSWVGEPFPVKATVEEDTRFTMERTLTARLGCLTFGVHLNGYVVTPEGIKLWVATRSKHKPTFPGLLDNMVGGGQPEGLGLFENMIKECGEEAGIPEALAQQAHATGTLSYCHTDGRGLKRDILYCYDLALPADFEPVCADGEVESFELLPIESVLDIIATTDRFKYNCNLVIVDFAIRHGVLNGDNTPEYAALCARANQLQWP